MVTAHNELKNKGFETDSLGLLPGDCGKIDEADILLLPTPTTRDGKNIFCPLTKEKIPLEIVKQAKSNALILSCGYKFSDCNCIDYLTLENFCLLNAVPTAEGAIARAIIDTPFCLWQAKVLVIGYGKVGKILADRLLGLKCDVTVSARKDADFALLNALNIKHIKTNYVPLCAEKFDIIFNTVDFEIFKNNFEKLKDCYIYDLSTKGCIDYETVKKDGIKAVKLPGIPGKTSPETAGKIIAQTVTQLVKEVI